MKTKYYLVFLSLMMSIILNFSGCREYKTSTKINSDGSCERTVIVKDNTVEPDSLVFPIPADKSWRIERMKAKDDTTKIIYSATKYFNDVESLNNEYKNKEKIGITVNLKKEFRWFYTYYDYEEVYLSYFPFKKIPITNFLTSKEYESYLNGDTTKALKKRLDKFAEENYFEYFFDEFMAIVEKNKIADLTPEYIASKKAIISKDIEKYGDKTEELIKYLEKILGAKSVWKLKDGIENIIKTILDQMGHFSSVSGKYGNEVTMPGIILSTNAKTIEGNKAVWEFDEDRFCFVDNKMVVKSRIINVWAFVVSGIVVLAIVFFLVLVKFRKR